jgi:hypothetical protein
MARTTITIDTPVYNKIKDISRRERRTVTRVIGDLLEKAIRARSARPGGKRIQWHTKKMGAKIDYRDKDELYRTLESSQ